MVLTVSGQTAPEAQTGAGDAAGPRAFVLSLIAAGGVWFWQRKKTSKE